MGSRYGSRFMPAVVDEIAESQPNLTYAYLPRTANLADGFNSVSFSDIAAATNILAAWIRDSIGPSSSFDTIAYIGLGDPRYTVVFLAAVKCGYKVLLPSIRNTPWMNASLLEQTNCSYLLYGGEVEDALSPLFQKLPGLKTYKIQPLEDLLASCPAPQPYPFDKDFESAKWDPILILHSSGSTGLPKPIVMNHATFAVSDHDRLLDGVPGRVNQNYSLWDFPSNETFFSPFPAFHLAGFTSMIMLPIYYPNAALVLGPPNRPPTGHLVNEIMHQFKLKAIFCPPIIAEQLVQEPGALDRCSRLKFLLYAGGPLSQATGDALSKVTDVCQFYGQTETGPIQALVPAREDWAYLEWHPKQEAIMEPSIDGSYEMTMKRNPALVSIRNLSCNFPDAEIWRTRDLFKPHPTKPGLWRFYGRADDIVVLSNGEKFNPVPSETQIAAHPLLSGALIIGDEYPQAALILEPKDYPEDPAVLIDQVWPTILEANDHAPGHAKIIREMVLVASPSKPFDRAGKGTVIRRSTGRKYKDELDQLHARDVFGNSQGFKLISSSDLDTVTNFVNEIIAVAIPRLKVKNEEDLYGMGMDSLQTTHLVSLLKAGILAGNENADVSWVSVRFVYEHPSVVSLAEAIFQQITSVSNSNQDAFSTVKQKQRVQALVEKHTKGLPKPQAAPHLPPPNSRVVMLTGSTGSLGMQVLLRLQADPSVTKVYCLDRSHNAQQRVLQALEAWPQPPTLDTTKVEFHQTDLGKMNLGLSPDILEKLSQTVTVIIHNAWKVDFNHPLSSYEATHIKGIRNLIDFSVQSTYSPHIVFISSISSVGDWQAVTPSSEKVTIPESLDAAPPLPIGYGESKAVAEHMLSHAAADSGVHSTVLRIGQIAGPVDASNGAKWNAHEWFPLLIKTSKALGKVPRDLGSWEVDWVPVDVVAEVVTEVVARIEQDMAFKVLHVLNPDPRPWSEFYPVVKQILGDDCEGVGLREWVEELGSVNAGERGVVERLPAVKILRHFQDMIPNDGRQVVFSTEGCCIVSQSLNTLGPVRKEWLGRWLQDMGFGRGIEELGS